MALLAHRFSQRSFQMAWVHNGVIGLLRDRLQALSAGYMQFTRTMTSLTADGIALERRREIVVHRAFDVVSPVGMTKEAVGQDGSPSQRSQGKSRRKVPY